LLERERDFVLEAQLQPEDPNDKVRWMCVGWCWDLENLCFCEPGFVKQKHIFWKEFDWWYNCLVCKGRVQASIPCFVL
jgi:hypothetical protein